MPIISPVLRERALALEPGDPEVDELGRALRVEEDVPRLQVAVQDPALVHVGQPARELRHDPGRLDERERPLLLQAVGQVAALGQVHDEERGAAALARREDAHDVGVAVGRGLRDALAAEALDGLRVGAGQEHLDRRARAGVRVVGGVDRAHAAAPEEASTTHPCTTSPAASSTGRRHAAGPEPVGSATVSCTVAGCSSRAVGFPSSP